MIKRTFIDFDDSILSNFGFNTNFKCGDTVSYKGHKGFFGRTMSGNGFYSRSIKDSTGPQDVIFPSDIIRSRNVLVEKRIPELDVVGKVVKEAVDKFNKERSENNTLNRMLGWLKGRV